MGTGYLRVSAAAASGAIPVADAKVTIMSKSGEILYNLVTGPDGSAPPVSLSTPDAEATLDPYYQADPYYTYNVKVEREDYKTKVIRNVKIWGDEDAVLLVNMLPLYDTENMNHLVVPNEKYGETDVIDLTPHALKMSGTKDQEWGEYTDPTRILPEVVFPDKITVHLCKKEEKCANVTIPFIDYIKNVCTNEIYDTWPVEAIKANIYAEISLAVNRIYTEWYPPHAHTTF